MNFRLKVRPFEEKDICSDAPFMPNPDNFEMYLQAFIEDIQMLETVRSISRDGEGLSFVIETQSSEQELLELMKPLFQRYWDKIRYVGIIAC
jgi:hypothetical protein